MKHTPRPLQVVLQDEDSSKKWYDIWSPTYGSVAHLSEVARSDEGMQFLKGDAYLFAAAPDLYAELENIAYATPGLWEDPTDFRAWAQSRARHALAKARGES